MPAGKTPRKASAFSWDAVDESIVRALLNAVYEASDQAERAPGRRRMTPEALRASAARWLGTPPRSTLFLDPEDPVSRAVVVTLRDKWLRTAPGPVISGMAATVQHSLSGATRSEPIATKGQQVSFLMDRRVTATYRKAMRRAFLSAHRQSRPARAKSPAEERLSGRISLIGEGSPDGRTPYPCQVAAQHRMRLMWEDGHLQGRLVLPTGAGKTDTVAGWLLARMAADPDLRVLWLAHQRELADQAVGRFEALARHQPVDFARTARVIHSGASALSTLADDEVSLAAVTYQAFRSLNDAKRRVIQRFLERPTVLVVDEAHHAGAPSYAELLDQITADANVSAVIGLTATPYPTSPVARSRFLERFPETIFEETTFHLVRDGVLAVPVVTAVDTDTVVTLEAAEVRRAQQDDLPPEVLRRVDAEIRNRLVVQTWKGDANLWGKTLVFAVSIDHANRLAELLGRAGAKAKALHSATADRYATLEWFKQQAVGSPTVLVSVGMLTEGVDLPDARTAFLARPTTSPILMRQMVGRVLRGPAAGGEPQARVVYFRDIWPNLPDILQPEEVLPGAAPATLGAEHQAWSPGELVSDEELHQQAVVAAQASRALRQLEQAFELDDDDGFNDHPIDPRVRDAHIVGFYQADGVDIAVFDHQVDAYDLLFHDAIAFEDLKGWPFASYFSDLPGPYPSNRWLRVLVDLARENQEAPMLHQLDLTVSPAQVAQRILSAGPLTTDERHQLVADAWQPPLARAWFPSLEAFEEAVDRALRDLRSPGRRSEPESRVPEPTAKDLPLLPRRSRDLDDLYDRMQEEAVRLLPSSMTRRLADRPKVDWTNRVVSSTFAHWSLGLTGRGARRATIRVNRLLRTGRSTVPDDVLCYLLYHEVLHNLLPANGHDAQFRELEARWPGFVDADLFLDTLHERFETRPERYNR